MKGVILSINGNVTLVDIHHEIPAFDTMEAAFSIGAYYRYFPAGTIHVCVVDPGVGSLRRPVIVSDGVSFFVGPDNGIFSQVYRNAENLEVIHITAREYILHPVSSTFHGRDIFAPAAAWLSKGIPLHRFGEIIDDFVKISFPLPGLIGENVILGEIVFIDHFGNAITNIAEKDVEEAKRKSLKSTVTILCRDREVPIMGYYAEGADKALSALFDSSGLLELFVYRGNAAEKHTLKKGEKIQVLLS